jgi:hypothetical protein
VLKEGLANRSNTILLPLLYRHAHAHHWNVRCVENVVGF